MKIINRKSIVALIFPLLLADSSLAFPITIDGSKSHALPKWHFAAGGDFYIAPDRAHAPFLDQSAILLSKIFNEAHLATLNFEGALSLQVEAFDPTKKFLMQMSDASLPWLASAGIHAVSLANNHSLDFGFEGLKLTTELLSSIGVEAFGAGSSLRAAMRPHISTMRVAGHQFRLCSVAFSRTYPSLFWASVSGFGAAHTSFSKTAEHIQAIEGQCDWTVVQFHWGTEASREVQDYQRKLAHVVIAAGADMVVGHHPHVVQTVEFFRGKPIFYSLGNLIFTSFSSSVDPEGIIVRVALDIGGNSDWQKIEVIPVVSGPQLSDISLSARRDLRNFLAQSLQSLGCQLRQSEVSETTWTCVNSVPTPAISLSPKKREGQKL